MFQTTNQIQKLTISSDENPFSGGELLLSIFWATIQN
jgi:hypothetical protein